MENYFGFKLPKAMHKEFSQVIQALSEKQGEVSPDQIMNEFKLNYLDKKEPLHFRKLKLEDHSDHDESVTYVVIEYTDDGVLKSFEATGNGPIDAVQKGLQTELGINVKILDYTEHALSGGASAQAAAYIHMLDLNSSKTTFGVGTSSNITKASIRAIFSALNRLGVR